MLSFCFTTCASDILYCFFSFRTFFSLQFSLILGVQNERLKKINMSSSINQNRSNWNLTTVIDDVARNSTSVDTRAASTVISNSNQSFGVNNDALSIIDIIETEQFVLLKWQETTYEVLNIVEVELVFQIKELPPNTKSISPLKIHWWKVSAIYNLLKKYVIDVSKSESDKIEFELSLMLTPGDGPCKFDIRVSELNLNLLSIRLKQVCSMIDGDEVITLKTKILSNFAPQNDFNPVTNVNVQNSTYDHISSHETALFHHHMALTHQFDSEPAPAVTSYQPYFNTPYNAYQIPHDSFNNPYATQNSSNYVQNYNNYYYDHNYNYQNHYQTSTPYFDYQQQFNPNYNQNHQ